MRCWAYWLVLGLSGGVLGFCSTGVSFSNRRVSLLLLHPPRANRCCWARRARPVLPALAWIRYANTFRGPASLACLGARRRVALLNRRLFVVMATFAKRSEVFPVSAVCY